MPTSPFWETKSLDEMSDGEWESLCDRCGLCCLHKLEDEDTGDVVFTRVACKLLNTSTCQCSNYDTRFSFVPDCLTVKPLDEQKLAWLPDSCAYKLLSMGEPLKPWHPLISGRSESVHEAGISMRGACVSEREISDVDYIEYIVEWKPAM